MIIIERNEDSKKGGYSSWSYLRCLEQDLLQNYSPGSFFQQDNAPIHCSKEVKEWLEEHGIWTIDWPSHSPDLNPIEHVWKKMKDILHSDFPELSELGSGEADRAIFKASLKEAWARVPQSLIDGLIDSVPKGWKPYAGQRAGSQSIKPLASTVKLNILVYQIDHYSLQK